MHDLDDPGASRERRMELWDELIKLPDRPRSAAAAPPPALESETRTIQQYWNDYWIERGMHGAVYEVSDTGARSFAQQWARVRAVHLQAELEHMKRELDGWREKWAEQVTR